MHELATTPQQRQVLTLLSSPIALGRPFFAPPDIPPDRLAALRSAFTNTMNDQAFISEAQQLGMDLNSLDGEKVKDIVDDTVDAPLDAVTQELQPPEGSKPE